MEKLIITSKILYDYDVSKKMNELVQMNKVFEPQVIYSSDNEWKDNKEKAFAIIKSYIHSWNMRVEPTESDGSWIKHPTDVRWLFDGVNESLNSITKNKYRHWCSNQAMIIATGILGFIIGLQKTGNLIFVWGEIEDILYNFITEQLILSGEGHGNDYGGLLGEICLIHCEKCDKNYSVVFECPECNDDEDDEDGDIVCCVRKSD